MDDRQRQFAQFATALNQYVNNSNGDRNSRERLATDGRSSTGSTSSGSSSSSGNAAAAALWGDLSRALQFNYSGFPSGTGWPASLQGNSDYQRFTGGYGTLNDAINDNRGPMEPRTEGRRVPSKGETKATPPLPPGISPNLGASMGSLQQLVGLPNEEVYRSLLAQQYAAAAAFSGLSSGSHPSISPIPPTGHSSPSPGQVRGSPALSSRQSVDKHLSYQMHQRQRGPGPPVSLHHSQQKSPSPLPLLSMVGNVALPPLSSPDGSLNGDYFDHPHIERHQPQISPVTRKERLAEHISSEPHPGTLRPSPNLHSPKSSSLSPVERITPQQFTEREMQHYGALYSNERHLHSEDKQLPPSDFGARSGSESEGDQRSRHRRKQEQPKRQTVIYPATGHAGQTFQQNLRPSLSSHSFGASQGSSSEDSDEYEPIMNSHEIPAINIMRNNSPVISNSPHVSLPIGEAMSHALSHPFLAGHINTTSSQFTDEYSHFTQSGGMARENNNIYTSQHRDYGLDHGSKSHADVSYRQSHSKSDSVGDGRLSQRSSSSKDSDNTGGSSANTSYESVDKEAVEYGDKGNNVTPKYSSSRQLPRSAPHENYKHYGINAIGRVENHASRSENFDNGGRNQQMSKDELGRHASDNISKGDELNSSSEDALCERSNEPETEKSTGVNQRLLSVSQDNSIQNKEISTENGDAESSNNTHSIIDKGQCEVTSLSSSNSTISDSNISGLEKRNMIEESPSIQSHILSSTAENNSKNLLKTNSELDNIKEKFDSDKSKTDSDTGREKLPNISEAENSDRNEINPREYSMDEDSNKKSMGNTKVNGLLSPKIGKDNPVLSLNTDNDTVNSGSEKESSHLVNGILTQLMSPSRKNKRKAELLENVDETIYECPDSKRSTRQKRPVSYVEDETDLFLDLTEDVPYTSPVRKRGRKSRERSETEDTLTSNLGQVEVHCPNPQQESIDVHMAGRMPPHSTGVPPELTDPLHVDVSNSYRTSSNSIDGGSGSSSFTSPSSVGNADIYDFNDPHIVAHGRGSRGKRGQRRGSPRRGGRITPEYGHPMLTLREKEGSGLQSPHSPRYFSGAKTHPELVSNSPLPDHMLQDDNSSLHKNMSSTQPVHSQRTLDIPSLNSNVSEPNTSIISSQAPSISSPPLFVSSTLMSSCDSSKIVDAVEMQLAALHKHHVASESSKLHTANSFEKGQASSSNDKVQIERPVHKPMLSIVPLEQLTYEGLKAKSKIERTLLNKDSTSSFPAPVTDLHKENLRNLELRSFDPIDSGLPNCVGMNDNGFSNFREGNSDVSIPKGLLEPPSTKDTPYGCSSYSHVIDNLIESIPMTEQRVQMVSVSNEPSSTDNGARARLRRRGGSQTPKKNESETNGNTLDQSNGAEQNGNNGNDAAVDSPSKARRSRRTASQRMEMDCFSNSSLDNFPYSEENQDLNSHNTEAFDNRAPPSRESLETEMELEKRAQRTPRKGSQVDGNASSSNKASCDLEAETIEDIAKFLEATAPSKSNTKSPSFHESFDSEATLADVSGASIESSASLSSVGDPSFREGRPKRVSRPPPGMNDGEMNDLLLLLNMDDDESEDEDYIPIPFDTEGMDSSTHGSDGRSESEEDTKLSDISSKRSKSTESKVKKEDKADTKKGILKKSNEKLVLPKQKKKVDSKRKSEDRCDRRGPILKLSSHDEFETIVNAPDRDEDVQEKGKKSGSPFSIDLEIVSKCAKVGYSSTLNSNYDAFTKDLTWFCAFCKKYSHYRTLGDLFGPFYVKGLKLVKQNFPDIQEGQIREVPLSPTASNSLPLVPPGASKPRTKKPHRRESMCSDQGSVETKRVEIGACSPPSRFVPTATPARMLGRTSSTGSSPRGLPSPQKLPSNPSTSSAPVLPAEGWTPPIGAECWVHETCVLWSSGVTVANGKVCGLEDALQAAQESRCSHCGEMGATVCCLGRKCPSMVHVSCARFLQWSLDTDTFRSFCPSHFSANKAVNKGKSSLQTNKC